MKARPAFYVALVVFALAFAFPPTERTVGATYAGDIKLHEGGVIAEGFQFIGAIGGTVQIRYAQWVIELLVLGAATMLLRQTFTGSPKNPPVPAH